MFQDENNFFLTKKSFGGWECEKESRAEKKKGQEKRRGIDYVI